MARNQLEGFPFHTSQMDITKSKVRQNGSLIDLETALAAAASGVDMDQVSLTNLDFWTNVGAGASVAKFPDRVMIGSAVDTNVGTPLTGAPAWFDADYIIRDAHVGIIHSGGMIGIGVACRSSDYALLDRATIGFAGIVVNDKTSGTARPFYAEAQHEAAASAGASYGMEIVGKDKSGVDSTRHPYGGNGRGIFGIYMVSGGDPSYGGSATNNSNTAILVDAYNGSYRKPWNKGIVFTRYALEGTDGTAVGGATATAIEMAYGHAVRWYSANGSKVAGGIRSLGTSSIDRWHEIQFLNDEVGFNNPGGSYTFDIRHATSGVNYLRVTDSANGSPVVLSAHAGDTDTAIDISITPLGTGVLRFGTRTAIGAETVTGYITIKDSGGTTRKLAVVS